MLDKESINPIKSNVLRVKHEAQTILLSFASMFLLF